MKIKSGLILLLMSDLALSTASGIHSDTQLNEKNTVFFIEGFHASTFHLMDQKSDTYSSLNEHSSFFQTNGWKSLALAKLNNFDFYDPILSANDRDTIYEFIARSPGSVEDKTELFDLLSIRILVEMVYAGSNHNYINQLIAKNDFNQVNLDLYTNTDQAFPAYLIKTLRDSLVKLINNGYYDRNSIPPFMYDAKKIQLIAW